MADGRLFIPIFASVWLLPGERSLCQLPRDDVRVSLLLGGHYPTFAAAPSRLDKENLGEQILQSHL
jgi:hypothetical protein